MLSDTLTMFQAALENCERETAAINEQMKEIIAEGPPPTIEQRENQKRRFLELVLRSVEAARRLVAAQEAIQQVNWDTGHDDL